MNKWSIVFFCAAWILECGGREPFKPAEGSLPFIVYFLSRYRGMCVGTLISRTAVLTAAVCVTNPQANIVDTRPINVVAGATYRHQRRGIRVQVTKILIPNLSNITGNRGYLMEKSVAVLLLKRKIPDVLTEIPLRAIPIDFMGEETLALQEECFMAGWHFFYKGDMIYPVQKFLLQRNLRVQFLNIVKKSLYCQTLSIKFQKALSNLGFQGFIESSSVVCVRDPDRTAQPCHGMYGAPLLCRGKVVGVMMAPDAQWSNCTGHSNIVHLLSSNWLRRFMLCISSLFEVDEEHVKDWQSMKKAMYQDLSEDQYDYVPLLYDHLYSMGSSSSDED